VSDKMPMKRFSTVMYSGDPTIDGDDGDTSSNFRSKLGMLSEQVQKLTQHVPNPLERAEKSVGKIGVTGRYHRAPRTIEEDLRQTSKILGTGLNGAVRLATSRTNPDCKYAVKSLMITAGKKDEMERLLREMEIFLSLDHPRIARLFDVYESKHRLDIVMELMEGGEVFDRIAKNGGAFSEDDAADALWQMLLAVNYMHSQGMVHRDIKLENFLYMKKDGNLLKLIDFGFSKVLDQNSKKTMGLTCGTLSYMAPEVLKHAYTSQCDLWSLGVVAFSLLMGYMPFHGGAQHQASCIQEGKYEILPDRWEKLSEPARDFLMSLLQVDEQKRLTADAALQHQWLATKPRSDCEIDDSLYHALRSFSYASRFRRCCMAMMAWNLSRDEQMRVSEVFIALDGNKDGHITREELSGTLQGKFDVDDEELEQILTALDWNKDDEITYSEFLAAMVSTKIELQDEIVRSTFRKFDIDRTGYISVRNLRAILGKRFEGANIKTLLSEMNLSNQSRITYPEFEAFLSEKPLTAPSLSAQAMSRIPGQRKFPKWLSCFPCCSS